MPKRADPLALRVKAVHPHQWLWEPLETDRGFFLRAMFGAKAVYLDGRIMFCFCAGGEEPWNGVLVCTDRPHHAALVQEFPELVPHKILPKWLYLSEERPAFDRLAQRLVALARQRDPRIGVEPKPRKKKAKNARARPAKQPRNRP